MGNEHGHSPHAHSDPPGGGSWADMAEELVADAELLAPVRDQALAILHRQLAGRTVVRVLDLGCGPGVTTVALAQSFPEAVVTAADGSEELLHLTQRRAAAAGVADRVTTVRADIEGETASGPGPYDVVWASMVLHHLADLGDVLRRLRAAMSPGGWLALIEFGGPLSILPAEDQVIASGAWGRFTAASREALGHHLPHGHIDDWPARLAAAGYVEVSQQECFLDRPAPLGHGERTWLLHRLGRERQSVAERLSADDMTTIDALLDPSAATGILCRADVHLRVGRLVLTAQRPAATEG
ncbi:MAG: class I SAM-dependent methyltransferase [Acidimicrobiales bacterium]